MLSATIQSSAGTLTVDWTMEHKIKSTDNVVVDWGTQAGNHVPVTDLDGMLVDV